MSTLAAIFGEAADATAAAVAIRRLFARDPQVLRTAPLSAAAQVRSDGQHFSDLFTHYRALVGAGRTMP